VTDSGGIQKEAYFYDVPCITLRDETEWVELVEAGVNILAGTEINKILELLNDEKQSITTKNIYGEGDAAKNILDALIENNC